MISTDITQQELMNAQHTAATYGVWLPALAAVIGLGVPYLIYKFKERADRKTDTNLHMVSLLRNFSDDLYGNAAIVSMFSDIRIKKPLDIVSQESTGRSTLARLLETINLVGIMVRKEMIEIEDVANSSIAYFTLCVFDHDGVKDFLLEMDEEHQRRNHPALAFVEAKKLADSLQKLPSSRAGNPVVPCGPRTPEQPDTH